MSALIISTLLSSLDPALTGMGYRIALVGMTTVFLGLVVLSLSLPLIRRMAEGKTKTQTKTAAPAESTEPTKEEIVAAVAAVHAHMTRLNTIEEMQLTWEMYDKPYSPWRLAGRAKLLTDRAAFRQRRR